MKCAHCNLEFKKEQMIFKNNNYFCCKGCESVWEILHESGLDEFYNKLGKNTLNPVNFNIQDKNYDEFIKKTKDGFSEIYLIIHGIECSACVWLNEKILIKEDGILDIDINLLTHKAKIVFDENIISLQKILMLIESIGYKPSAYDPLKQNTKATTIKREFYAKMIVAIACLMNIMWVAIAKYAGFFSGMSSDIKDILNYAEFLLCTPVLFYTGSSFYKNAYYALKNNTINMDLLVISGASIAYVYSIFAMFLRVGEVYFDSVSMIICFVFIGKYLEVFTKKRALDTIDSLNEFLSCKVLVFESNEFIQKDAKDVKIEDIIKLKSGDKVLIDGICIDGQASIDTSSLSGESEPIFVKKDDFVSSACIVIDGNLTYKATSLYKDSRLNKLINLLEFANSKKAKIQNLVDKINIYFSKVILSLSLLCFLIWFFYFKVGFEISLINAISVLIIACPCALALATPVSNLVAISKALKEKILFKQASNIEELSKCDVAVFDKTGVLTDSKLKICNFYLNEKLNINELYSFVNLSKHPISLSVSEFLKSKNAKDLNLNFKDIFNIQAKGIKASFDNNLFIGGNYKFIQENGIACKEFENSHFVFVKNGEILAYFEFLNNLKDGACELISYLKKNNFGIYILSGDNEKALKKVADKLNIKNYEAFCTPEYKMEFIQNLGKKYKVLFVGDGINDSLALKSASIAISLKQASDLAINSSDVILLKNDLHSLKKALILSKKTYKIIKSNLAFSLIYNGITIPLAFLGYINPLIASISMSLSSIIVILNALRIKNE